MRLLADLQRDERLRQPVPDRRALDERQHRFLGKHAVQLLPFGQVQAILVEQISHAGVQRLRQRHQPLDVPDDYERTCDKHGCDIKSLKDNP